MKILMGGATNYIRVLAMQFTGHVVWLSIEPLKSIMPSSRVPSCVPGLDYLTYVGTGPTDIPAFYGTLKKYNLICNKTNFPVTFESDPLPPQMQEEVKLFRSKCYAVQNIQNLVNWALEKNALYENPLADPNLDPKKISEIYQQQMLIGPDEADRLVKFKYDEQSVNYANIKYSQIEAELAVTNAKSVTEVSESYKNFIISLGNTRVSDQAVMQWL